MLRTTFGFVDGTPRTALFGSWLVLAIAITSCADNPATSGSTPASSPAPTTDGEASVSQAASCIPQELRGAYHRERTGQDTSDASLVGTWTLTLDECAYRIAMAGAEQGSGHLTLVSGNAAKGRLGLSDDFGCPNASMAAGFYDFTFAGGTLAMEEAIAATDPCVGRADAFVGTPGWMR